MRWMPFSNCRGGFPPKLFFIYCSVSLEGSQILPSSSYYIILERQAAERLNNFYTAYLSFAPDLFTANTPFACLLCVFSVEFIKLSAEGFLPCDAKPPCANI